MIMQYGTFRSVDGRTKTPWEEVRQNAAEFATVHGDRVMSICETEYSPSGCRYNILVVTVWYWQYKVDKETGNAT